MIRPCTVAALEKMGVGLAASHFFMMYTASFAFVTPPVAPGAVIASKVAGASYFKTAIEATKVAVAGLILPYMFVFAPVLLFMPQAPLSAAMCVVAAIMCLISFQVAFVGYYISTCHILERILALGAAAFFLVCLLRHSAMFLIGGLALFAVTSVIQWRKKLPAPVAQNTLIAEDSAGMGI